MNPQYIKAPFPAWCVVHQRLATHVLLRDGEEPVAHCAPNLGGITFPCNCRPYLHTELFSIDGITYNAATLSNLRNNLISIRDYAVKNDSLDQAFLMSQLIAFLACVIKDMRANPPS